MMRARRIAGLGVCIALMGLAGSAHAGPKTEECKNAPNGWAHGVGNGNGNAYGHHKCDAVGAANEVVVPVVEGTSVTPIVESSSGTVGVRGSVLGTEFELVHRAGPGSTEPVLDPLSTAVTEAIILVKGATEEVARLTAGTTIAPSYTLNTDGQISGSVYLGSVNGSDVGLDVGPIPIGPIGPGIIPLPDVQLAPSVNTSTDGGLSASIYVGSVDGSEVGLDVGPIPIGPIGPGIIPDPLGLFEG